MGNVNYLKLSPDLLYSTTMNDQATTINELKALIKKFCDDRNWDKPHTAKDLAIGLVTESSELLEIFRFKTTSEESLLLKEAREAVADELADSFYFLLRFAERYGFDLSTCVQNKLIKNELKYPATRGSVNS